ncbi:hypothetical protein CcaverHIS002_0201830 [Cutaneotrichosporon cavernicola]|uniref:RanBP2-type domain-containing protein n=1 Tax=Cutaneotrichosporon cavernicola TaxID=279322 RepID=A0AA48I087_9TREE|nr:uncharacterized protein CcaverHIS019_0201860 [Cutaneotrichosporon cavernicola]BEI81023.1 hypothetical protein CcaverHIS002_0201830 [Cutaneotrichosporon cavernicola]BEI88824.1 hypothetical protein CcaverHIS019_0201860 [Cutaneotrichosporon cavernicola]
MNRASSRKDLRAERISNSPYRRERPPVAKQRSWLSTLATSISSSFSSLRARDGSGSVSGSDDEWGGEAPSNMVGQDVFSLAEAAGRTGDEFEARAEAWRANKSLLRSRRLSPSKSSWSLLDLETKRVRPSPSMPALQPLASSSNPALFRTPTTQVGRSNGVPPSASAAALHTFVSFKGDGAYSAQDIESMETLLRSVKADSLTSHPTGGWSGALTSTRKLAPSTSGSSFSLGSTPPAARPLPSHSRVKYLGPGMSPRRFATTSMRSMSSLFADDTPGKKRKTLPDVEVEVLDDEPSGSTPNRAASKKAAEFNQRARIVSRGAIRPSPLGQSITTSPDKPPTPRDIGRKRVNDMIQDVLDNEITPHEEKPQQVFNPYESVALPAGKHYSPYASLRKSSGTNGSMRRSLGSSRGAAAKLDSERGQSSTSGRPLSTLDLINSGRPSIAKKQKEAEPSRKQKKPVDEPIAIDDDDDDEPAAPSKAASAFSFTPSRKTPAAVTIDEPEPVSAFPAPSLSQSMRGPSPPAPKPAPLAPVPSTSDSIIAASMPAPAPIFSTQPLGLGPPPSKLPATPSKLRAPTQPAEKANLYMSAKDTALNVDKNALPFFTFTLPPGSDQPHPSEAIKAIVSTRPAKTDSFTFELPNAANPTSYYCPPSVSAPTIPSASFSLPKKVAPAGTWTCDMCMLQNTAADTEKCGVCEAPKPGAKPKATAPAAMPSAPSGGFGGFGFKPPAKAAGAWTCDVCMLQNTAADAEKCSVCEAPKPGAKAAAPAPSALPSAPSGSFNFAGAGFKPAEKVAGEWDCDVCSLKNPASATDKCTICEAPKPGAKVAAPVAPSPMPAAPSGGFSFGAKPAPAGDWTCDLCMLKNPATATDKCTVCEAPRPGAAPKAAAMPAAPPSAPTGGFSFGGKSLSTTTMSAPPAAPAGGFSFGGKPVPTSSSTAGPTVGGFKAPTTAAGGFSFGGKTVGGDAAPASPFGGFGTPPAGGFFFGQKAEDKPAMLSKPTGAAGEWTCSLCGLLNPASATDKCTICEAPK